MFKILTILLDNSGKKKRLFHQKIHVKNYGYSIRKPLLKIHVKNYYFIIKLLLKFFRKLRLKILTVLSEN